MLSYAFMKVPSSDSGKPGAVLSIGWSREHVELTSASLAN